MTVDIRPVPREGWDPLPRSVGGVVGRVLVREEDFFVAQLRFREHASVHEHPGENEHHRRLSRGRRLYVRRRSDGSSPRGQQVRWPKDVVHRLWTEDSTMTKLMVERTSGA